LFAQHLQYLQDNDFKVLKLKTMLERLDNDDLPNKCVVLTADDAYQATMETQLDKLRLREPACIGKVIPLNLSSIACGSPRVSGPNKKESPS
jgi:hypothetical protein